MGSRGASRAEKSILGRVVAETSSGSDVWRADPYVPDGGGRSIFLWFHAVDCGLVPGIDRSNSRRTDLDGSKSLVDRSDRSVTDPSESRQTAAVA